MIAPGQSPTDGGAPERKVELSPLRHDRDVAGLTYVYPVVSRRAGGVSVGINLNTNNACNWRCIYCQVPDLVRGNAPAVDLDLLGRELRGLLQSIISGDFMTSRVPGPMRVLQDIALSGNGEPTSAAEFAQVIELVGSVLDEFGLGGRVVPRVITNGSLVERPAVQAGLERLAQLGGEVWFKVDAGSAARMRQINGVSLSPQLVARRLAHCAARVATWVQTCVFALDGKGPAEADIADYLQLLREAGIGRLKGVLLYGIARPSMQPEAGHLSALPVTALEAIAARLRAQGLRVEVSP